MKKIVITLGSLLLIDCSMQAGGPDVQAATHEQSILQKCMNVDQIATLGRAARTVFQGSWLRPDPLQEAIGKNDPLEVQRIIAARSFTKDEKDHYKRCAENTMITVKPGLKPRLNKADVARLGLGTGLAAGGAFALSIAWLVCMIDLTAALEDSFTRRHWINDVEQPRPHFIRALYDRFRFTRHVILPVASAVAAYSGYRMLANHIKGYYTQQPYDAALCNTSISK